MASQVFDHGEAVRGFLEAMIVFGEGIVANELGTRRAAIKAIKSAYEAVRAKGVLVKAQARMDLRQHDIA